ncbi:MAG: tRNA (adenosine(37)-N6)-dimethylallyltransferase MiaA, partial [Ilumatobacteraceae bacterium]
YKELLDEPDEAAAVEAIIRRTRRFGVRQERWFRRDPRVRWISIDQDPIAEAAPTVVDALRDP